MQRRDSVGQGFHLPGRAGSVATQPLEAARGLSGTRRRPMGDSSTEAAASALAGLKQNVLSRVVDRPGSSNSTWPGSDPSPRTSVKTLPSYAVRAINGLFRLCRPKVLRGKAHDDIGAIQLCSKKGGRGKSWDQTRVGKGRVSGSST